MLQFGQTRIETLGPGEAARPCVLDGSRFTFIDSTNTAITDQVLLEYEGLDGRWYETLVTWRGGRWWGHRQQRIRDASSRTIDQAELRLFLK